MGSEDHTRTPGPEHRQLCSLRPASPRGDSVLSSVKWACGCLVPGRRGRRGTVRQVPCGPGSLSPQRASFQLCSESVLKGWPWCLQHGKAGPESPGQQGHPVTCSIWGFSGPTAAFPHPRGLSYSTASCCHQEFCQRPGHRVSVRGLFACHLHLVCMQQSGLQQALERQRDREASVLAVAGPGSPALLQSPLPCEQGPAASGRAPPPREPP